MDLKNRKREPKGTDPFGTLFAIQFQLSTVLVLKGKFLILKSLPYLLLKSPEKQS